MKSILQRALLLLALWTVQAFADTGTVTYFHNDPGGNPVMETNAAGAVVWQESYYPYGGRTVNAAASADNRLWFASRPYDSTAGLSYMGARYFDPVTGRFFSMDPAQSDPKEVHEFNRYAYANNNPIVYVDTNGRSPLEVGFAVVDVVRLGFAIYSGAGVGEAAFNLGADAVGIFSPVPGTGFAIKALRGAEWGVTAVRAGGEIAGVAKATELGFSAAKAGETTAEVAKEATETARVGELLPTHGKTMSNNQLNKLVKDIRTKGIQEPLTITEHNGKKYILDGHHRALAAPRAGISEVPVNKVQLPFGAYKTPEDLTFTPGGY